MTRKLNIDNGLQDLNTEYQAVTACIMHLPDSADVKGSGSNKLCSNLTGSRFESSNGTIQAKR